MSWGEKAYHRKQHVAGTEIRDKFCESVGRLPQMPQEGAGGVPAYNHPADQSGAVAGRPAAGC